MRRLLLRAAAAAALLLTPALAAAQDPNTRTAAEAMSAAKDAYNREDYPQAAALYLRAAQLDPGARTLKGEPYRNLARSLFWQERFDHAAFWYDVYLKKWPKNKDFDQVSKELQSVNAKRANPDQPITPSLVYPQPLLDLAATLHQRLKDDAPALTAQGGGTAALYALAVERGYALPDLADAADLLREDLLRELERRLQQPDDAPIPLLGGDAEPIAAAAERLRALRTLPLTKPQLQRTADLQLLTDALRALANSQHRDALAALDTLASREDTAPPYLPYLHALALLRASRPDDALQRVQDALPAATPQLRPWLLLLRAELLRAQDKDADAARDLLAVLAPAPTPDTPIKLAPPQGAPPSDEPDPPTVKTLQGSDGEKTIKIKTQEGKND